MRNHKLGFWWDSVCGEKAFNYDAISVEPEWGKYPFFIMADGVGSKRYSKFAATLAISRIEIDLRMGLSEVKSEQELEKLMDTSIKNANVRVLKMNRRALEHDPRVEEGKTTIDVGVIYNHILYLAHVGDGRIYVLNNKNQLERLTEDETSAFNHFKHGLIAEEEIKVHPNHSKLDAALGFNEQVTPKRYQRKLEDTNIIFAATDGLYCRLTDNEIESILKERGTAETKFKKLLERANNPVEIKKYIEKNPKYKLSNDNITGMVITIKPVEE